jgi:hypothetical protein
MPYNHSKFREKGAVSLCDLRRTIMNQILDVKSFLMLDHISQDEAKGIFFHHLVKPSSVREWKARGEEKLFCRIPAENPDASREEHPFHRRGVVKRGSLDRFDLLGKVLNLSPEGSNIPKELLVFRRVWGMGEHVTAPRGIARHLWRVLLKTLDGDENASRFESLPDTPCEWGDG